MSIFSLAPNNCFAFLAAVETRTSRKDRYERAQPLYLIRKWLVTNELVGILIISFTPDPRPKRSYCLHFFLVVLDCLSFFFLKLS